MTQPFNTLVDAYRTTWTQPALRSSIALITLGEKFTYSELSDRAARIAGSLKQAGVRRGDLVAIVMQRSPSQVLNILGTLIAGACPCPMERHLAAEETGRRLDAVDMHWVIYDSSKACLFDEENFPSVRRLPAESLTDGAPYWNDMVQPDDPALLLFTSGSTGRPKGVLLSHRGLLNNAFGIIRHTELSPQDRLLHVMPLYHTNGLNNQLFAPLQVGATIALADRYKAESMPMLVEAFEPTIMTGVPTMYARMLNQSFTAESLKSLRFARCGSAPITADLHRRIEAFLGCHLLVSYGLSEATCTSTMNPPAHRKIGSVGTVLCGQEVSLRDPHNEPIATGQEGEICIGGSNLMLRYLGDESQKETSPIQDDLLKTGDLGTFDDSGYLYVTGRIKDVIIRGGENLSPSLIESVLMMHSSVMGCCVVGAPDRDLGEVPVAFVVPMPGKRIDISALRDQVAARLGYRYSPAEIVRVKELPETSVGKIDRKAMAVCARELNRPDFPRQAPTLG